MTTPDWLTRYAEAMYLVARFRPPVPAGWRAGRWWEQTALAAMKVTGDVAENLRTADSGAQKRKGFCRNCGSPLYNKPQNKPDMVGVYVGTLDDPSGFRPQIVMFASRGQSWDHLDPALPRIPNMRVSS